MPNCLLMPHCHVDHVLAMKTCNLHTPCAYKLVVCSNGTYFVCCVATELGEALKRFVEKDDKASIADAFNATLKATQAAAMDDLTEQAQTQMQDVENAAEGDEAPAADDDANTMRMAAIDIVSKAGKRLLKESETKFAELKGKRGAAAAQLTQDEERAHAMEAEDNAVDGDDSGSGSDDEGEKRASTSKGKGKAAGSARGGGVGRGKGAAAAKTAASTAAGKGSGAKGTAAAKKAAASSAATGPSLKGYLTQNSTQAANRKCALACMSLVRRMQ